MTTMKTSPDALLLSPSYRGTSFAEIADGLVKVIREQKLAIDVIGIQTHFANTLPADKLDDTRFVEAHHQNLTALLKGRYQRVLTMDFYGLGLDMIQYQAAQEGRNIEFGTLFHGASFMDRDVYKSSDWISKFELAWGQLYSTIYSPSADSIKKFPDELRAKVKIFPWGMDTFEAQLDTKGDKPIEVLFPHRLSADKGIADLIEIATTIPEIPIHITVSQTQTELKKNKYFPALNALPNIRFIVGENDTEHQQTLARTNIVLSSAYQELFGYSVMKAVAFGATPIVPNRQCYPYYFEPNHLYDSNREAGAKIKRLLTSKKAQQSIAEVTAQIRSRIIQFSFETILRDFFTTT